MALLSIFISLVVSHSAGGAALEEMQKAIIEKNLDKVTALLEAHPDENFQSLDKNCPNVLFLAIQKGSVPIIEALLTHAAFQDFDGYSSLAHPPSTTNPESQKYRKIEKLRRKLKKTKSLSRETGFLPKEKEPSNLTKKIKVFTAPYFIPGSNYFSPLHCATFASEPLIAASLLSHGHESQLLQQNEEGDNPLHIACMRHDKETLLALLGVEPLHKASFGEYERYLSLSLAQYNNAGRQPLHELLSCKSKEPAELLIHLLLKNANPCAPVFEQKHTQSPMALAIKKRYFDCAGILSLTPTILMNDDPIWHYLLSKIERGLDPWRSVLEDVHGRVELFHMVASHIMSLKKSD